MKKIFICFIFLVLIVNILISQNIQNTQSSINYEKSFATYKKKDYTNSYNMFKYLSENEKSIISDYILYYYGRSAMQIGNYSEAKTIFERVKKEYTTSLLLPYAQQYGALSSFTLSSFPVSTFFYSKEQDWIKKFVGIAAMPIARNMKYTNEAKNIALEIIKRYKSVEGADYYHTYHKSEIKDHAFAYTLANIFYNEGESDKAYIYYKMIAANKTYKEDAAYYMAKISEKKKQRSTAIDSYKKYLQNTNYIKYRRDAEFSIAEQYNSLRNYEEANKAYISFISNYPTSLSYIPNAYRRVAINYLRQDDIFNAKPYIDKLYKSHLNDKNTDVVVRTYMRKSFTLSNQTEATNAVKMLYALYTGNRRDYGLSWGRWTHMNAANTNEALKNVEKTLFISKNPHYILEAYTAATEEMKISVSLSNELYLNEAKKFYNVRNIPKAYEMLNKVQFNDAIVTGEETHLLKEVRDLAKTIMLEKQFVKDFYSKKSEETLLKEVSKQTGGKSDKVLALFNSKDYDNAVNELEALSKKTKMTYPLFYLSEKILLNSDNEYKFFLLSYRIGKYFDYPYHNNVELLPNEMQKYVYPRYFDEYVVPEAGFYKVEPSFVYAIMREESTFRHYVMSWAGAYGLMQLMPGTANIENANKRYNYKPLVLIDKKQNINLGIAHISRLLEKETNYMLVSAKYNAGSGNAKKWINAYTTNDMYYYSRLVGFDETEYYIERVMKSYNFYKRIYKE